MKQKLCQVGHECSKQVQLPGGYSACCAAISGQVAPRCRRAAWPGADSSRPHGDRKLRGQPVGGKLDQASGGLIERRGTGILRRGRAPVAVEQSPDNIHQGVKRGSDQRGEPEQQRCRRSGGGRGAQCRGQPLRGEAQCYQRRERIVQHGQDSSEKRDRQRWPRGVPHQAPGDSHGSRGRLRVQHDHTHAQSEKRAGQQQRADSRAETHR